MNHCKECGKDTKNPKYCNKSCSAKFNNRGRQYRGKRHVTTCKECGNRTLRGSDTYCQRCIEKGKHVRRIENIDDAKSNGTRRKLLEGELGHQCQVCKRKTWNGQPIPLELEHIDGNSENNKRKNLTLICPNCHAQTPTYKGKNVGNGRHWRRQRYHEGKSY